MAEQCMCAMEPSAPAEHTTATEDTKINTHTHTKKTISSCETSLLVDAVRKHTYHMLGIVNVKRFVPFCRKPLEVNAHGRIGAEEQLYDLSFEPAKHKQTVCERA